MSALALAWVLHHPRMNGIVIGPRRPAHLDDALTATTLDLSDGDRVGLATLFPAA